MQHTRWSRDRTGRGGWIACPMCESAELVVRHCKAICESCGYVESCEDNFVPTGANPIETG